MVNSQVVRETIEALKLDINIEAVPNPVPIVNVTPKEVFNGFSKTATGTVTGSVTAILEAGKQNYITGIHAAYVKDATCDIATGSITITAVINGVSSIIGRLPVLTTTAQQDQVVIYFRNPLKVNKDSNIALSGTFTAGVLSRTITAFGYTDEID